MNQQQEPKPKQKRPWSKPRFGIIDFFPGGGPDEGGKQIPGLRAVPSLKRCGDHSLNLSNAFLYSGLYPGLYPDLGAGASLPPMVIQRAQQAGLCILGASDMAC